MERWRQKVALVTGAGSGIGAATCHALARHGLHVIGCDVNLDTLQAVAANVTKEGGKMTALHCDLTKSEQIEAMFQQIESKHGGLDILVNNAGTAFAAPLLSGDVEQWRTLLNLNVLAVTHCAKLAVKSMRAKNVTEGQIINMCSRWGHLTMDVDDLHFYMMTKHAIKAFTEGLRNELEKEEPQQRIRVAQLSPGTIFTNIARCVYDDEAKVAQIMKSSIEAEHVADAILYILQAPKHVQIRDIHIGPMQDSK